MENYVTKSRIQKSVCTFLMLFGITLSVFAQAPDGINYQAAIRDGNGTLVKNQLVNIKFTVSEGISAVYVEEHTSVSTTAQGLVNLVIGEGTALTGNFADINWMDNNQENLEVEVDLGSGYVSVGTQDFESVPYALNMPNQFFEKSNSLQNGISYIDTLRVPSQKVFIATNRLRSGSDLLTLEVPDSTSGNAQFIELQRGNSVEARINTDGSSEFQHVELTDTAGPTNAPKEGAMYADNAPMAWGYVSVFSNTARLDNDFGIASVTRNGTGDYTITLDNSWMGEPAIIVTPITASGAAEVPGINIGISNNSFDVFIRDGANPSTLKESNFMVVVYGRPQ